METRTEKKRPTDAVDCGHCRGKGTYMTTHNWSDGLGHVHAECPCCNGSGWVSFQEIVEKKAEAANLYHEVLHYFRALLLAESIEQTGAPRRDLPGVSGPAPHLDTWRAWLGVYRKKILGRLGLPTA